MKGTMKAAVLKSAGNLVLEQVPIPEVGPNDVLIKVINAGICGSDLHEYSIKLGGQFGPVIMGHEFVGILAEIGSEVSGLQLGERVLGYNTNICGQCYFCQKGDYYHCIALMDKLLGINADGCFAEYVLIRNAVLDRNILKVPDEIPDNCATMIEPTTVGTGHVPPLNIQKGEKVVILGAGTVGLIALQSCKHYGAEVVIMDLVDTKLELALQFGADAVHNPKTGDAVQFIIDRWGNGEYIYHRGNNIGGLADYVFEAAGSPKTFEQAFKMVKAGGKIIPLGVYEECASINPNYFVFKDIHVLSGLKGDFHKSIEWIKDKTISAEKYISHEYDFEDIQEAIDLALSGKATKVLIHITKK